MSFFQYVVDGIAIVLDLAKFYDFGICKMSMYNIKVSKFFVFSA